MGPAMPALAGVLFSVPSGTQLKGAGQGTHDQSCVCEVALDRIPGRAEGKQDQNEAKVLGEGGEGSKWAGGKITEVMCLLCLEKPEEGSSRYQLRGPGNLTPGASDGYEHPD